MKLNFCKYVTEETTIWSIIDCGTDTLNKTIVYLGPFQWKGRSSSVVQHCLKCCDKGALVVKFLLTFIILELLLNLRGNTHS